MLSKFSVEKFFLETGIPRFLAALEMGGLGDHPAPKDTDSAAFSFHRR